MEIHASRALKHCSYSTKVMEKSGSNIFIHWQCFESLNVAVWQLNAVMVKWNKLHNSNH